MIKQALSGRWKAIAMGNSQHFDTIEEAEAWIAEMNRPRPTLGEALRSLTDEGYKAGTLRRPGGNWGNENETSYR